MSWQESKELREKRAEAIEKSKVILDKAKAENRDLTDAEVTEVETHQLNAVSLAKRADLISRHDEMSKGIGKQDLELSDKVIKRYSLFNAINQFMKRGDVTEGLEGELNHELQKFSGKTRGFRAPWQALAADPRKGFQARDVDSSTAAGAIATNLLAGDFIEALRPSSVVMQLGARVLSDLVGSPVEIPRHDGTASITWINNESGAASESSPAIGQVSMTPGTVTAYVDLTRKALLTSSLDLESIIRQDLIDTVGLAIDAAAIAGSGSGAEPTGIEFHSGVADVATVDTSGAATLVWADIVKMETTVASANGLRGSLVYLTHPVVKGKLKATDKATGAARFLWEGNEMNGYNAVASTQVTHGESAGTAALIFGNFRDVLIGLWSGIDLLPNPYANATSGGLRLHVFQDADIELRHGASFARITDVDAS